MYRGRPYKLALSRFAVRRPSPLCDLPMTALHPGDQLDHYRIEALVARSGMASIFRATDMRNGRQVAIKIPHPEMEARPGASSTASSAKPRSARSSIIRA